jgi:large subunit ribosomal protein L17
MAFRSIHEEMKSKNPATPAARPNAGHKRPGDIRPALVVAQGKLARRTFSSNRKNLAMVTMENALTEGTKRP